MLNVETQVIRCDGTITNSLNVRCDPENSDSRNEMHQAEMQEERAVKET